MSSFESHVSSTVSKVLIIGNQGSGKTGLLGSLANAGYRLFIHDFDNGLDILKDPMVLRTENRKNVFYKTFTDKLITATGVTEGYPKAWTNHVDAMNRWTEFEPDGKTQKFSLSIFDLGPKDVVCVDTLTNQGNAALRNIMALNNRQGQAIRIQDWGAAMALQEGMLQLLYSDAVKCNIVVNSHLTFVGGGEEGSQTKALPSALGNKLPPKIGSYFNSVLAIEKQGVGTAVRRVLRTVNTTLMELKNPAPSVVPADMVPDLATYFEIIQTGKRPAAAAAPPTLPVSPALPVSPKPNA